MPAQDGGDHEELLAQPAVLHVAEPPVLDHVPVEGVPLKMERIKERRVVGRRRAGALRKVGRAGGGGGVIDKS